jgi:branched-subunit amino acid transport protein
MSDTWALVVLTVVGCYGLKLAGYVLPERVLNHPRVRTAVGLLPVALLAALVVVQALANGEHLSINAPLLIGVGAGVVAIWRRAPFIIVVVVAGATAALLRLL